MQTFTDLHHLLPVRVPEMPVQFPHSPLVIEITEQDFFLIFRTVAVYVCDQVLLPDFFEMEFF